MLKISDLKISAEGNSILKGLNLQIKAGQVHVVMGPNGSGKSTLANYIAGKPGYAKTAGVIKFKQRDLESMSPDERAKIGLFLAFQHPIEIEGVGNGYFLRSAVNAKRRASGQKELDAFDFLKEVAGPLKQVGLDDDFLERPLNAGFSGGEKKRNEILQMLMLKPDLSILDETDSGLDVDALKIVSSGIEKLSDGKRSFLIITHNPQLLEYIKPDYVHVLDQGQIVESGGMELARRISDSGFKDNPNGKV